MQDRQFQALAKKVDELIALCGELDRENRDLKRDAGSWQQERQILIDRSELAKAKVEAMIGKLKALEHET
ncbi:MAG: cell division protein ZapB [Halieaceae bacterium]|jgi:cell division protein ZapB